MRSQRKFTNAVILPLWPLVEFIRWIQLSARGT
jgi:hypothetical protein